jgi:oligopeptidase A
MNPLLDFSGLPRFDAVTPEHVAPAIRQLIDENRGLIDRLIGPQTPATWDDFVQPMLDAGERLSRAWGIVGHLHSVNDVPPWREAYNALLPEVSSFHAELGQNLALFAKVQGNCRRRPNSRAIAGAAPHHRKRPARLPPVRRRAAEDQEAALQGNPGRTLRAGRKIFREPARRHQCPRGMDYRRGDLAGLPEDAKAAASEAAAKDDDVAKRAGWKFTLHAPSYMPVLQFCDNRGLRERMYRAYATRASEFGKAEWDNGPLIGKILALRDEEARMLGYTSYADVSLATKMADTPAQVAAFLRDMAKKARPFAQRDVDELRDFARTELGLDTLESWDIAWASEKLKQQRYSFSDDEVKQYFPEPKVLTGLFRVIESLFAVTLRQDVAPAWHPDVRFFRIERDGRLIGQFYLDLYARDTKRGGAWMDEAITRRRVQGGVQTPVAYLNCNFPAPVGGRDATFSHDDVITLFHECGHGLHHLLTQVDELPVSGIHGVEWDAVELPSQFMENYCWEWDVLTGMTAHAETGQPLPRVLYDRMIAAKNFQSGMFTLRQTEFALFDLLLHGAPRAGRRSRICWRRCARRWRCCCRRNGTAFRRVFAHLRRRLRGRLLQLQMGGSALGRRLRGL